MSARQRLRLWLTVGAIVFGAVTALATVVARRFAVKVVTPPGSAVYDQTILAMREDASRGPVVTLPLSEDSCLPGEFSLVSEGGASLTVVGDVIATHHDCVDRVVLSVTGESLVPGDRVKFCGWHYLDPSELRYPHREVTLRVGGRTLPAWVISPVDSAGDTWAVHIHGRATRRSEVLRSAAITASRGMASMIVTYRNDEELLGQRSGRYDLGVTEWRDVDAAVEYALTQGASKFVLYGWSMGAVLSAQLMTYSQHRAHVIGAIFDSPALDWREVLMFQGQLARLPGWVTRFGVWMLSIGIVRAGSVRGVPFDELNAVDRLASTQMPILILHSTDDGYVPIHAADRLARLNRHVTLERFSGARHVKLWNANPAGYERVVNDWLSQVLSPTDPGATSS